MAVTIKILNDGPRNHVVHLEVNGANSAAVVVDASAMSGPLSEVKVNALQWSMNGADSALLWDADVDVEFMDLAAGYGNQLFERVGGLINSSSTGKTGDILLTNGGGVTSGSITLWCKKR